MKVYIVIESQEGQAENVSAYKTRKAAEEAIEDACGQPPEDWLFENGTLYLGNNNYETLIQIAEREIR